MTNESTLEKIESAVVRDFENTMPNTEKTVLKKWRNRYTEGSEEDDVILSAYLRKLGKKGCRGKITTREKRNERRH